MQKIKLSPRLAMLADMVLEGDKPCDIGTDHGYLPLFLLQNGKIQKAIASDINKGPLASGLENATEANLQDKISFRLGAGLEKITPDECDTIIIAGMGGETISGILRDAPWASEGKHRLILQPMTLTEELRFFLYSNGYEILSEKLSREGDKIYLCIEAVGGRTRGFNGKVHECIVSQKLENDVLCKDYYNSLYKRYKRAYDGIKKGKERDLSEQENHIIKLTEFLEKFI